MPALTHLQAVRELTLCRWAHSESFTAPVCERKCASCTTSSQTPETHHPSPGAVPRRIRRRRGEAREQGTPRGRRKGEPGGAEDTTEAQEGAG